MKARVTCLSVAWFCLVASAGVGSGLNEDRIDESKSHVPVRRLVLSLRIRRHARRSGRIGRPGRSLDVR